MENKEFFIDKDGFSIHAKLDFPKEQQEKMPLVILAHGLTGHMEEWHLLCIRDSIVKCGYACLRVELYGHGETAGAFYNHNLMEWVSELVYVIDYARKLPFVSDVILSGHSQGGLAAILAAGLKGDQLKAMITFSAALNIPVDCREGNFFGTEFDPQAIPEELTFWETHLLGGNYIRIAQQIDPSESIKAYRGPVLMVHGSDDGAVLCKYSVQAVKEYANGQLALIEGDGHCYEYHLDLVKEKVEQFLHSR